ncbi:MAG: FG-GAP-like repeat-containing protein [Phycisphaerae bacterium]
MAAVFGISAVASARCAWAQGGNLTVTSVQPAAHTLTAPTNSPIVVNFDRPVDPNSVVALQSFWAFGRWSGTVDGTFRFSNGNQTVALMPNRPFSAGEVVMVILSHDLQALDGTFLRSGGYSYQFWTAARPAAMDYFELQVRSTNTNGGPSSRPYGGVGTDFNGDGWLDVSMINEDTQDLRVYLNTADGTGTINAFIQPPFPLQDRASPNEPTDFNRDGLADLCVCNINPNTVSILLGNGDGTFAPQQIVPVGSAPRGIAVLDVDGDGDMDIVNTNSAGAGTLSVLTNDGMGVFGAPSFFEAGGTGEWALAAADMNEDGLLDLVVGARGSSQLIVQTALGDGTFAFASTTSAGGPLWMLVTGDVDGDGHEDVATVNSSTNDGSILLGDGTGGLFGLQTYPTDPFGLATDLGDLDGDGDLDWITSSFGGDWFLFTNDGSGTFAFDREFLSPQAASCCVMLDMDNDGDLDLALIDELQDVVIIMSNGGPAPAIPAVQSWGLLMAVLLTLAAGTIAYNALKAC